MSSKLSGESFIAVVERSGLVETQRLQKLLGEMDAARGDRTDPLAISEHLVARQALTSWQAEKLLQGKHKGYFLGNYRLLSLLGRGGMSSVYLAEHMVMRRRCAIKVLPAKRVGDTSYLARFHREAQAVAALDHPNIVRAYDVNQQTDRDAEIHFLVMEYVEGSSLQDLVTKHGPLPIFDAVDDIRQAAVGLVHAHKAGMVHRDIKPGNLLRDNNGTVKILDLGLARYFGNPEEQALTITHDEKVLGTADYLAPEQALDSHTVDARADIYSLGCTLYFLLTGHPPFTEGTLAQRLLAHQTKDPSPIEQDRPETPKSLLDIVRKMMAKKAEDRYATAQEVADVLLKWLSTHADADWKQAHSEIFSGRGQPAAPVTARVVAPLARPATPALREAPAAAEPELASFFAGLEQKAAAKSSPRVTAEAESGPPSSAEVPTVGPTPLSSKKLSPKAKKPPSSKKIVVPPAYPTAKPVPIDRTVTPATLPAVASPEPEEPAASATTGPDFSFLTNAAASEPVGGGPSEVAGDAPAFEFPTEPEPERLEDTAAADEPAAELEFATAGSDEPTVLHVPAASRPPGSPAKSPADPRRKNQRQMLIAAVIGGLVAIGGAGAWWNWSSGSKARPSAKTPKSQPVETSKADASVSDQSTAWAGKRQTTVGPDGEFATLSAALEQIQRHFRPQTRNDRFVVKVAAGTYPERLRFVGKEWPNRDYGLNVVIRGEGAVTLAPGGGDPVIRLDNARDVQLINLRIDARNKPVAIELADMLDRCRLQKLTIEGFTDAGIALRGALGSSFTTDRILLDELRLQTDTPSAVGARAVPGADGVDCGNIVFQKCRFLGPLAAGVTISGKEDTRGFEFRYCIFAETDTGIALKDGASWREFTIVQNTFYKGQTALRVEQQPDASAKGLSIRRNLFIDLSGPEAVIERGYAEQTLIDRQMLGPMRYNWSNRPQQAVPGALPIWGDGGRQGEGGLSVASTDPGAVKFLAPGEDAAQRNVGGQEKGESPWLGAIGP